MQKAGGYFYIVFLESAEIAPLETCVRQFDDSEKVMLGALI